MDEKLTEEVQWELLSRRLTFRQQRFCEAYLGEARGNTRDACRLAGYEGTEEFLLQTGNRLIKNPAISRYLHERSRKVMRADEALQIIGDHARGSMEDFLDVLEDGSAHINLIKASERGQLHLIKKLKNTREGLEIELYDAQTALAMVCRNLSLFNDQMKLAIKADQIIDALPEDIREGVRHQLAQIAMEMTDES